MPNQKNDAWRSRFLDAHERFVRDIKFGAFSINLSRINSWVSENHFSPLLLASLNIKTKVLRTL